MNIRMRYRLFKQVGEIIVPDKFDSFKVITVNDELDPNSPEGREEIITQLHRAIGEPKANVKVLDGTLV
ncbi:hypothetical protein [Peribacillus loiseleuriae]|uniref:Uncharacterized protein n=1 Tax=Peribacillus loiseleuriae TaxID=1679170 RepID=A0A0K9GSJ7_9BACI|nr:hypothetical protein [Peribacillus loiseleuriae]KMY49586.1 hypothetical protein AC625_08550 [Peribacillus loiseleuriae]